MIRYFFYFRVMKRELNIVFMGTPDFAVPSLKVLVDHPYNVVAVVTAPDKPAGRGRKIKQSAIKEFGLENSLNILQPTNLKDPEFAEQLTSLKANLFIVVAFRMLPQKIWQIPKFGTFNLHASLLPQYRGAAPINWAIVNGETKTGVTTFFIDHKIDTGKIIMQEDCEISMDDNAGGLHDKLMNIGSALVLKTVTTIENNQVQETEQQEGLNPEAELKPAPKIQREDLNIDWDQDSASINNFVRGMSPYPGAYSEITLDEGEKTQIKMLEAIPLIDEQQMIPGQIDTDNKSYLKIGCRKGTISVSRLQMAGKKAMDIETFLRGFNINSIWHF
jgi:methionyl-tRNA formyltransferase